MATFEQFQTLLETMEKERIERKQELKEALSDQSEKLERKIVDSMVEKVVEKVVTQMKGTVETEVDKAMKPVKDSQAKTDAAVTKLAAELESLASKVNNQDGMRRKEILTNKEQASSYVKAVITGESIQPNRSGDQEPEKDEMEIRNLFKKANSTITVGPNTEEDWRELVSVLQREERMDEKQAEREALGRMIEEYLEMEMAMKVIHIKEVMSRVVDIAPIRRSGWKSLVVKFDSPDIVDWILKGKGKMRQGVEGESRPVVQNWVPDGIYRRYNAVRSAAYKIRHEEKLQTRIIFGEKDFQLVTRRNKDDFWGEPVPLSNLPDFQISASLKVLDRGEKSPTLAPGRARYGGAGARSEKRSLSTSPGHSPINKQSKVSDEISDDNEVNNDKSVVEIRPARSTRANKPGK